VTAFCHNYFKLSLESAVRFDLTFRNYEFSKGEETTREFHRQRFPKRRHFLFTLSINITPDSATLHSHVQWRWNRQRFPKRRHFLFTRRGTTQKKKSLENFTCLLISNSQLYQTTDPQFLNENLAPFLGLYISDSICKRMNNCTLKIFAVSCLDIKPIL
jgi:hypothetical protein